MFPVAAAILIFFEAKASNEDFKLTIFDFRNKKKTQFKSTNMKTNYNINHNNSFSMHKKTKPNRI
jgi:hypothetical protein